MHLTGLLDNNKIPKGPARPPEIRFFMFMVIFLFGNRGRVGNDNAYNNAACKYILCIKEYILWNLV